MSFLEPQIRDALHDRAEALSPPAPPLQETLTAGRAARGRRRKLHSFAAVLAIVAVIGGALGVDALASRTDPPEVPVAQPSSSPSTEPSESPNESQSPEPSLGRVTPCRDLPRIPQGIEIDTTLAWEIRQLLVSYSDPDSAGGAQLTFVLAFADDPTCRSRPDALRLINHALEAGGRPTLSPSNASR